VQATFVRRLRQGFFRREQVPLTDEIGQRSRAHAVG
jgi:hypothetical protein